MWWTRTRDGARRDTATTGENTPIVADTDGWDRQGSQKRHKVCSASMGASMCINMCINMNIELEDDGTCIHFEHTWLSSVRFCGELRRRSGVARQLAACRLSSPYCLAVSVQYNCFYGLVSEVLCLVCGCLAVWVLYCYDALAWAALIALVLGMPATRHVGCAAPCGHAPRPTGRIPAPSKTVT